MAALLLGAIGLSAQKIKEAHTKKKDRKALLLYEAERAELRAQEKLRREEERRRRRLRRSGNSSRGHVVSGWESDMRFFGEAPPPYEEVDSRGRDVTVAPERERGVERAGAA